MKKLASLVAVSAVAIAGAACGTAAASPPPRHPVPATEAHLDYAMKGHMVRASRGERVVVSLPSYADGGYEWLLTRADGLKFIGRQYIKPASDLPGATGTDVFVFSAGKPGRDRISLVDERPWKGGGVAERFGVTVVVG
jgi:predicted secreted protein